MFAIGDKVIINMPLQAGHIEHAKQKRTFNHRITTICGICGDRYTLYIDGEKYRWEESILGRIIKPN